MIKYLTIIVSNDNKLISITISIGIADNLECMAEDFNHLFNIADMRLYKAKKKGRNQICTSDNELYY